MKSISDLTVICWKCVLHERSNFFTVATWFHQRFSTFTRREWPPINLLGNTGCLFLLKNLFGHKVSQQHSHQRCDKERPPLKEWSSSLLFSVHEKTRVGSRKRVFFWIFYSLKRRKELWRKEFYCQINKMRVVLEKDCCRWWWLTLNQSS